MKIYFAGSIRGGRDDQETYSKIIKYLEKYGKILTEHVGFINLKETETDKYIYERDVNWIKEADVLIAEVSTPSLGVGYEIAFAEKLNIPILCLFNQNSNRALSAMITGNNKLKVIKYNNYEEAINLIDDFFNTL